jgi:hypothetical protein
VLLVASDNESTALAMTELANELMRVTEGQRWGVNLSAVHVEKVISQTRHFPSLRMFA